MKKFNSTPISDDPDDEKDDYLDDDGIDIFSETFDKDFDEIDFEGTEDDDRDEKEAERFGLD